MNQNLIFIIIVSLLVLTIQTGKQISLRIPKIKCLCGIYDPITDRCTPALMPCRPFKERPLFKASPKGTSNSYYKDNSGNRI